MKTNYSRLSKLFVDSEIPHTELHLVSEISTYTLARLDKNQEVTMATLQEIAAALDCSLGDIVLWTSFRTREMEKEFYPAKKRAA